MVAIEGETHRHRFNHMSQDLRVLVSAGVYVGIKYNNNNRHQFYCRPEWLSDDLKSYKEGFEPESAHLAALTEHKRKLEFAKIIKE